MGRLHLGIAVVLCAGCSSPAPLARSPAPPARPQVTAAPGAVAIPKGLEDAATAYRSHKTLANVEAVAAWLEPGMARKEVERFLGEPDGWDDPSVFYAGDRANTAGERLGLTLEYYVWYVDGRASTPSDRLERWILGSGNRFEAADPKLPRMAPSRAADDRAALEPMAAHYRQHRDYASLQGLVRGLRLGLPRKDVEALLGAPDHCAVEGLPCRYTSERSNAAGLSLGVSVDYRVNNVDAPGSRVSDRLEALTFGPIAPRSDAQ
jgi:hypothetical protein